MSKKPSLPPSPPPPAGSPMPDPAQLGQILLDVYEKAQPLLFQFLQKYQHDAKAMAEDTMHIQPAVNAYVQGLMSDPHKLAEMQMNFWQDWIALCRNAATRYMGSMEDDVFKPEKGDKRFKDADWETNPFFDFIKQSYLLTSKYLMDSVYNAKGLDEGARRKMEFFMRQFVSALAPTNFVLTNPEVLRATIESKGENLLRGLQNMLEDLERGHGELRISTTNYDAFKLGENIATTPGKVVFQNDLMELIQYNPATEQVFKRPLLIVPPWINKYYILDLKPQNSFIKWLVDRGHTVFVISWVNPTLELAKKSFDDYMGEGILAALDKIKTATGEPDCNAISYCLGGTLLSVTLAWLAAKGHGDRIASATFLTTLIDFEKAGDLKLFMDPEQLNIMERDMKAKGFLPASSLRKTFSMLRSNDMIWSFVVNNYLMGKEPFPFDLLYWNDDATNMPATMHSFYMRKFYGENLLSIPEGVTIAGVPIDMRKVKTPAYFLSAKDDHIAPWKATYAGTQMFKGPVKFTLSASGHVAGVVNPPAANKYCYWTAPEYPARPDEWLAATKQNEGSWWTDWAEWIKSYTGPLVPAREPGGGKLKPLESAPGSYVKAKAD